MKKRTKAFSLTLVGALVVSMLPLHLVTGSAAFEKNAHQVVEDINLGWNLGNSLDAYSGTTIGNAGLSSETAWGNPATTQAMIDMVHDTGINTVRVPITWYNHMDPTTYKIDDAWMSRVKDVVDYVIADDMYCIINVHHDTGENGWLKATSDNLPQKEAMFTAIWEQISEEFAGYGDKLIFESLNEILDGSANQWYSPSSEAVPITNELNQIFVDTVRKSGGNNAKRNLIVNTYCAGANKEITGGFVLPNDTVSDRLIVETHIYQPFPFTSENYPEITTWDSQSLDMYVNNIYDQFVKNGTPVIIGEFGCANKNNSDQIASWAKYYLETCQEKGIKCIWWDNGAQYKLFNRRTLQISEPEILNTMLAVVNGEEYVPDTTVYGDADGDDKLTVLDVVQLQKYLLCLTKNCDISADMNKDNVLDVFDLALMKRSLLEQSNLTSGLDNWNSWVDTSAGADGEMTYTANGVNMQVNAGGEYEWNAQFFYEGVTLEQGATYQITFDYKADSKQTTSFHVMQGHDDYLPYYSGELNWTTAAQHYEDTFEYTEPTDKVCRVGFNLGGDGVNVPFNVEVANLKLVKVSGGTATTQPTTEPTTQPDAASANLCESAENWNGWYNEDGANASFIKQTDGMKIEVRQSGEVEWYVQDTYANLTLEKGATYCIEFDYIADRSVNLGIHVQQNYDPYEQYLYSPLSYTATKQHFRDEFKMTAAEDDAVIVFSCGGADANAPFAVTITGLTLTKIS